MKKDFIDKETIEYQFISFCKAVLCNELRDIYAEEKRWNEKYISLENLSSIETNELCVCDCYEIEAIRFRTHDYVVFVEDEMLAEALTFLSAKQQDIILLSFFLEKKDVEIATLMGIARSTLHYQKTKAFDILRKIMRRGY